MKSPRQHEEPVPLSEVLLAELRALGKPLPDLAAGATEAERLSTIHRHIDTADPQRSALCISGGGIRSATFALGAVQALSRRRMLGKFDYLSTVSGGGYLGSFLSAWSLTDDRGVAAVEDELGDHVPRPPDAPEAPAISHLRRFSNYISPKLSLFSADSWTLIATAIRNLLLNWTVILSLLTAALVLPWFGLLAILGKPEPGVRMALLAVGFIGFAVATGYPGFDLPSFKNFAWKQRQFLLGWLAPIGVGIICVTAWWAGYMNMDKQALNWMRSGSGLLYIAIYFSAASLAGVAGCAACLWCHDSEKTRALFRKPMLGKILACGAANVLVGGVPAGLSAWWAAGWLFTSPAKEPVTYMTFAPPFALLVFFLLNCFYVGFTSRFSDDEDREWWARTAGWVGAASVAWLVVYGLLFYVPHYVEMYTPEWKVAVGTSGGLIGFICARLGASEKTTAFLRSNPQLLRTALLTSAAVAFFAVLACAIAYVLDRSFFSDRLFTSFDQKTMNEVIGDPAVWIKYVDEHSLTKRLGLLYEFPAIYWKFAAGLATAFATLFGFGMVMGFFVNANRFSLHATYRNRLVRAYLGAARVGLGGDRGRKPHPFTGFDSADNVELADLRKGPLFHVINMTLNLVGGRELAWQERKAASFTASPLHCGNPHLGYRSSERYAKRLSLGTALAISGAAASPNQGYNSSPLVTFLMTLFNLRLGWWLGNPAQHGHLTWELAGPAHAAWPLFVEALGLTNDCSYYVNLSDGGHFENLAIYEMIRRRCRLIVVLDAEQDEKYAFEGLGNAVRKARVDLGVPIHFRQLERVSKDAPNGERRGFAIGKIDYPGAEPGWLLYVKPLLCGTEQTDVLNYSRTHECFPHESTSDQFFSESQFESYRALGLHQMRSILRSIDPPAATLPELFARLRPAAGWGN